MDTIEIDQNCTARMSGQCLDAPNINAAAGKVLGPTSSEGMSAENWFSLDFYHDVEFACSVHYGTDHATLFWESSPVGRK